MTQFDKPSTSDLDAFQQLIRSEMETHGVPGVAVGLLLDGEPLTWGFGVASVETGQPVTPDTLFQIGSITKVFTATLVMRLVEQGVLDLHRPIIDYLPELRLQDEHAQQQITLWHLVTHMSGIAFDTDYHGFDMQDTNDDIVPKALKAMTQTEVLTAPGEVWHYSNAAFDLTGTVITQVTGLPYDQVMRDQLLRPLGLERACFLAHDAITHPVAVGHRVHEPADDGGKRRFKIERQWYIAPRWSFASGQLCASVDELLRFGMFHLGDGRVGDEPVLSRDSVLAMRTRQAEAANRGDAVGLSWALEFRDGLTLVEHGGSTDVFRAQLALVPERQFALAVLTNSERGGPAKDAILDWALERFCGMKPRQHRIVSLPDDELSKFVGTYSVPDIVVSVTVEDGGLALESTWIDWHTRERSPGGTVRYKPTGANTFVAVGDGVRRGTIDFLDEGPDGFAFLRRGILLLPRRTP